MENMFVIAISTILINNVVFARFLGVCPYLGVSRNIETSVGMGAAVTFVLVFSVAITYLLDMYLLVPFKMDVLRTVVFILVIAALVQIIEIVLRKVSTALYDSLGIYLPLMTTNCAILGVALLVLQNAEYSFFENVYFAFCSGLGFILAIVVFAGIRERLEDAPIPEVFKNVPIAFITAFILAMAFMGFAGLV